jgi:predicted AAA+ superfamily ATPase
MLKGSSMIPRTLGPRLAQLSRQFPVVTLTGPRQSGKTTLCREVFSGHAYVSLERPDHLAFARDDPRGFLATFPDGVILDEIQRAPELTSWLQPLVDDDPRPGRYVLTGSENLTQGRRERAERRPERHQAAFGLPASCRNT